MRAGEHLIADFKLSGTWREHQLASTLMADRQGAEQYIRELLKLGFATVVGFQGHSFEGGGVTLIFLLAESHISLHTWPEWNGFCMDFFTCGAGGESEKLFETIKNNLGDSLANVSVTTLIRHLG